MNRYSRETSRTQFPRTQENYHGWSKTCEEMRDHIPEGKMERTETGH